MIHPSHIPDTRYPDSWYSATSQFGEPRPALTTEHRAKVCVIGGGLAGLSVSLELLRMGIPVAIIESGRVAWGASGRNGGFVSAGYSADMENIIQTCGAELAARLYEYSVQGVNRVRENIEQLAPDVLMGEGMLLVSRHPAANRMQQAAELLNQQPGGKTEVWTRTELDAVIRSGRYYDALYMPNSFHIHPLNYALALAAEIESLGGRIFEASPARKLDKISSDGHNYRWRVGADSGEIKAEYVVVCTSGYDQEFYGPVSRSVLPVATHVAVTEPLDDDMLGLINTGACIADTRNACDYFRVVDRRLLWGGKISTLTEPPDSLKRIMQKAMVEVFPELNDIAVEYCWSGLMGYCSHKMPVIRRQQPGLWIATAFGGQGLNTTAIAGELISTAIVRGDERWKDFNEYMLDWNGGPLGQFGLQSSYWWMQVKDRFRELLAGRKKIADN
ncbi:MAG: NAD(P)/FAD-dependent oxidoreductase [bacterium]